jgi:hypothetical protein
MSNVIYSKLIIHPQYIPEWYNSYTMGVTSALQVQWPKEKGQTLIYKTIHRKLNANMKHHKSQK